MAGKEQGNIFKKDIDLMIVIGSKLSDMTLVDISRENYPKELIHLDYDSIFIGKSLIAPIIPIIY